jgi:hypothetical protein
MSTPRNAEDAINAFIEAERRHEQPQSLAGRYVSDEPLSQEARRLPFPSASTAPSNGDWEQLCSWMRGVDSAALDLFRLMAGALRQERCKHCGQRGGQHVVTDVVDVAGTPTPLWDWQSVKPTLGQVARQMGISVHEAKRLRRCAVIQVQENIAKGTVH